MRIRTLARLSSVGVRLSSVGVKLSSVGVRLSSVGGQAVLSRCEVVLKQWDFG